MGKRAAASKSTRGVSKARQPPNSSSSNPKTTKHRSQYNKLAVIAKGAPSKKIQNKDAISKIAREASERQKLLDGLSSINMIDGEDDDPGKEVGKSKHKKTNRQFDDNRSVVSGGSRLTTASFASVWSNCTNSNLNEFFQVWNPSLETHKDALAVIAGLAQLLSSNGAQQTDEAYADKLFKILSSADTPMNVLTGSLLALTFVIRKLPQRFIVDKFDVFYPILKEIMEKHHSTKKKSLMKSLLRCFSALTKAHPLGKKAIESCLRKKINIAIRQQKAQAKISL